MSQRRFDPVEFGQTRLHCSVRELVIDRDGSQRHLFRAALGGDLSLSLKEQSISHSDKDPTGSYTRWPSYQPHLLRATRYPSFKGHFSHLNHGPPVELSMIRRFAPLRFEQK